MTTRKSALDAMELTKEDLSTALVSELYWEQNLSQKELALLFGVNRGDVHQFMKGNAIGRRDLSQAQTLGQKKRNGKLSLNFRGIRRAIKNHTGKEVSIPGQRRDRFEISDQQTVDEVESFGALDIDVERSVEKRDDGVYSVTEYTAKIPGVGTQFRTTEETCVVPKQVEL